MLRIGRVQLATNLLLAPIAGYCDLAFRLVCREQGGVGLACTDLLSPQGLLRGTATSLDLARTTAEDSPVGMQLYGSDPEIMAQGARWAAEHGATVVDINMGCPVDKVTKKDGGSRLLCIPDTAQGIVAACVRVLEPMGIPLTCKMRLGWFNDRPVAEVLAPRLVAMGVAAVTVHGRTTEQKFAGQASLEGIARVVEAVKNAHRGPGPGVPVIGNGDVREPADALRMVGATGCDGVMIGRGALSTPWLFRDAWALLRGLPVPPPPSETQKLDIVRRYLTLMLRFRDERYALDQARKRITWFGKRLGHEPDHRGRPVGCRPLKDAVRHAASTAEVFGLLDRYQAGELRGGEPAQGVGCDSDHDGAQPQPAGTRPEPAHAGP
ncbi:MAG: tRNA dihydrouridine synthase DusB [Planctomyces sp.]|nr:tRNA dihydrouridine synthase DusB [Planctomyces sp.]MBA4038826.1 tRNA dihydrouridine synthase DusB [Planctomyces sp.]MBA4120768.1 tRNA dihydrouridine synthase DusB [Isosphaera sp.]